MAHARAYRCFENNLFNRNLCRIYRAHWCAVGIHMI